MYANVWKKGASAAIYGVRAGNGVVLVTTKKGAEGKAKVNYSGSFTFQTPSRMPALTNVYDASDKRSAGGFRSCSASKRVELRRYISRMQFIVR